MGSKFHTNVILTNNILEELGKIVEQYPSNKVFIVTDTNTTSYCLPFFKECPYFNSFQHIEIPADEENKSLSSVEKIWQFLSDAKADRKSLLINLGGGMLTDLASFAGATYKRGLHIVNIPTTLLSQVDASVGGKTGFNFNGLKNEIGVITIPSATLVDTRFLRTIDNRNILSGAAEMIKHGCIYSPSHLENLKQYNFSELNEEALLPLIEESVLIKDHFVHEDPYERGIRKALNFGHTVGHAIESVALEEGDPMLHGYAVAFGVVVELYLSHKHSGLEESKMNELIGWITELYGKYNLTKSNEEYIELMNHDKKNENDCINFSLLEDISKVVINQQCSNQMIHEALDFYRSL